MLHKRYFIKKQIREQIFTINGLKLILMNNEFITPTY